MMIRKILTASIASGALAIAGPALAGPAAFPSRESNMRVKGAAFRLQADQLAHAFDFRGKRGEGRLRLDAGP